MISLVLAIAMWILITGFGPFGPHERNPSWLAVQQLPDTISLMHSGGPITAKLVKVELKVAYRTVDEFYASRLPVLCEREGSLPMAIIHVGVAGGSTHVRLEKFAFNQAVGLDVENYVPPSGAVISSDQKSQKRVATLDLDVMLNEVVDLCRTRFQFKAHVQVSFDAGRYLCNYSYYRACHWQQHSARHELQPSALFVHVPEEGKPHSVEELKCVLHCVAEHVLTQTLDLNEPRWWQYFLCY